MNQIDLLRGIDTYVEQEWEDFEDAGGETTCTLHFYYEDPSQFNEYRPNDSRIRFFSALKIGKNPDQYWISQEKKIIQALMNALEDHYYQHLNWYEWFRTVEHHITSPTREE